VRHAPLVQPFPIVLEFLQANLGALPIAAATNENFGISNIVLRTAGLSSLFQLLVTADDVTHPKPAPDIYLTCAERLGVPPGECHVFEDSAFGIEAATAAGMIVTDVTRFL
ncbi:MAG: HAD family hydrolase, partial [Spirochaeta sp.]|nr:HAD family hydrolase [Spirochaeta sp.]